jgi:hypothetical protein
LERVPGEIGFLTYLKLQDILGKIPGFNAEMSIKDILLDKFPKNNLKIEYNP